MEIRDAKRSKRGKKIFAPLARAARKEPREKAMKEKEAALTERGNGASYDYYITSGASNQPYVAYPRNPNRPQEPQDKPSGKPVRRPAHRRPWRDPGLVFSRDR